MNQSTQLFHGSEHSENDFGLFVRLARVKKRIKVREMAKLLGCSPTYYSDIEHNRRTPVDIDFLEQIALHLDLDIEELYSLAIKKRKEIRFPLDQSQPNEILFSLVRKYKHGVVPWEELKKILEDK